MDPTSAVDTDSDPRITGEYVRRVSSDAGSLTLVGVVHDHPASVYRVRQVIEALDPDVLALELPPISIPLFEQYADTDRCPPAFGGEMSAAIQAAGTATTVGIDRPTGGFFQRLGRTLLRERPSLRTVRSVVSDAVETTKHAITCRAAAAVAARASIRLEVDAPVAHDVGRADAPSDQARDEREQVRRSRSFMNVFRTASRSRAARLEDAAREAEMAARLGQLREDGDTVAVVGIDHLDAIAERLTPVGEATPAGDGRDY
jgi:pheromone shutdown protein TraB